MEKLMSNKAGLVTGAGSGIGRTTAITFAIEGASVMVSDFNEESGKETVKMIRDLGGKAEFFPCDVSDEEQVKELVRATVKIFGKLDFAFNNAGTNGVFAPITQLDSSVFERVMKINVFGVWNCLKYEIEAMQKNGGGAIVNTSSGSGLTATAYNTPYGTSKTAVVGMTKCVALDYAKDNIRVNALCPGSTLTPMMMNAIEQNGGAEFEKTITKDIPMGAMAEPQDQADAVVWLCSDKARMITGVALPVDGGYILCN